MLNDVTVSGLDWSTISPSDIVDLPKNARGIYVGTGGHLALVSPIGTVEVFKNVISGALYPLRVARVNSTGTTATDLIGVF